LRQVRPILGVRVVLTADAQRQFDALPLAIRTRIRKLFARLAAWPEVSGVKPLRGAQAGHYRVRTGAYRAQLPVLEDVVIVVKVGHRDRFYES
jgi:mRNA-degrading endonuclease RelE of RelBE toxin-antitoxin system